MQKELLMKEKAKKESELRELAMKARMEKAGAIGMASRLDAGGELGGRVCGLGRGGRERADGAGDNGKAFSLDAGG